MANTNVQVPTPGKLLQVSTAFWASKALSSAVELGVFTQLAKAPASCAELSKAVGINHRGARDLFDALVSLGFLLRENDIYKNTPEAAFYLDENSVDYIGGFLTMIGGRNYNAWGRLTEALKTGTHQNEGKDDPDMFAKMYSDPEVLRNFLEAMTGISRGTAKHIAAAFDLAKYDSFVDVGCAQGGATVEIAKAAPEVNGAGFDLPVVAPIFNEYVAKHNLSERVKFIAGDFFKDELPETDVILMGHILHDWDLEQKKMLLQKAQRALRPGGVLLVYDTMIDDERRENTMGLLMSLNMLIETPGGFDYTGADLLSWMQDSGFSDITLKQLNPAHSLAIARK